VIELQGITKRFGKTLANDGVTVEFRPGEVHAVLGQNGAGKTTLMNILSGLYRPDSGKILVDGREVVLGSPRHADALGIQMVHQHFLLGEPFTAAENVILGHEAKRGWLLLDRRRAEARVRDLGAKYRLRVDPAATVRDLSVGARQRLEILKALYRDFRTLILDEPTAVLAPLEVAGLFEVIRRLQREGRSIIFISHKLREAREISDRITVLRQRRVVSNRETSEHSEAEIVRMMVGEELPARARSRGPSGPVSLTIDGVCAVDPIRRVEVLRNVDLEVRAGEILGIAGVEGNGQTELAEVLLGTRHAISGSIRLGGVELPKSTREIRHAGISWIPEDRNAAGLIGGFTVAENLALGRHDSAPICRGHVLDRRRMARNAVQLIEKFDIRPADPDVLASRLSGGNQQKLVLARELSQPAIKVLVASQPTRGLDVAATQFMHERLRRIRDTGVAVLMVSADLDEIRLLCDRIAVMYEGRVAAIRKAGDFTDTELGSLMLKGAAELDTGNHPAPSEKARDYETGS